MNSHGRLLRVLLVLLPLLLFVSSVYAEGTESGKSVAGNDQSSGKLGKSIARIKDDLKQKDQTRGNLVASSLSKWSPEEEFDSETTGWKALKALGLCLGCFFIGIGVVKKLGRTGGIREGSSLQIIDRLALSQKTSLLLVRVHNEEVLLTLGSEQASICNMDSREKRPKIKEQVEIVCQEDIKLSA